MLHWLRRNRIWFYSSVALHFYSISKRHDATRRSAQHHIVNEEYIYLGNCMCTTRINHAHTKILQVLNLQYLQTPPPNLSFIVCVMVCTLYLAVLLMCPHSTSTIGFVYAHVVYVLMFVCRISAVPVSEEPEYEDFDDKSAYSEVQFAPITTTPNAPNAHKGHKPLAPSPSAPPVPPRQSSKPSVIHKVRTYVCTCAYVRILYMYMYGTRQKKVSVSNSNYSVLL